MQTSGVVLDVYDDVDGESLRAMFPTREHLPEIVKHAHALSVVEHSQLPDGAFALVLVNGGEKLRKFACVDEGNTALSLVYFLKNAHKLPDEARKLTAENLKVACSWYGLDIPEELEKEAGLVRSAVHTAKNALGAGGAVVGGAAGALGGVGSALAAPLHAAKAISNPLAYAASNPLGAAMTAMTLPSTIKGTAGAIKQNLQNVNMREAAGGAAAGLQGMVRTASAEAGEDFSDLVLRAAFGKTSEAIGTAAMPLSASPKALPTPPAAGTIKKTGSAQHMQPVIDVTGSSPRRPTLEKRAQRYALGDKYPLDSYSQVKQAADYFATYGRRFKPEERHEYCVNLVKRANDLNFDLQDIIRKYGSEKYASATEMGVALDTRRSLLREDKDSLDLLDKLASVAPSIEPNEFVTVLRSFDEVHGFDNHYDSDVMDPYYSTYGFQKSAEDEAANFSDTIGNLNVYAADLVRLKGNRKWLKETFGDDFCDEYCKDPVGIYKSMPVEQKKLIIRMATENSPV